MTNSQAYLYKDTVKVLCEEEESYSADQILKLLAIDIESGVFDKLVKPNELVLYYEYYKRSLAYHTTNKGANMLSTTIRNLPRGSGKTTIIKLAIAEIALQHPLLTPKMIIITHSENAAIAYRKWAKAYTVDLEVSSGTPSLRGINEDVHIFIDEPFLIPLDRQAAILDTIHSIAQINEVTLVALGTLPETANKPSFKDYL
jgi:hypothetical protein